MTELPALFVERMRLLLSDEWESFREEADRARQYGLRVNTLKIDAEEFERIAPFRLTRIPWISNGYYYRKEDEPARHPYYAAGLYYLQEPSAMTPASRFPVEPGDRVLDLCAAPGGKSTEIASRLSGQGLLVANEINQARARALLHNMELWGAPNILITSEAPHRLAERFPEYFDKVMVDAPCSGEGMFRKNPAVMDSWREKGPDWFSAIQREIILSAADMLKPGGLLFYSTCTFAPEENEGVITHLLSQKPEMDLIPMDDYEGFSPGILSFGDAQYHKDCLMCRRIWPHRMAGEGHFMALLRKKKDTAAREESTLPPSDRHHAAGFSRGRKRADKDDQEALSSLADFLAHVRGTGFRRDPEIRGNKVCLAPEDSVCGGGLRFLRKGLYLGDLKKKRFEPAQAFALALKADQYDRTISFAPDDERLLSFLRGESIRWETGPYSERQEEKGWYLVLAGDYPVGWGRLVKGVLKNKIPAGWRRS